MSDELRDERRSRGCSFCYEMMSTAMGGRTNVANIEVTVSGE